MANYSDLKTAIDVYIRNNGNGEITGDILNQVLKNMVNVLGGGYQFAGAATTGMNPGTPDNNVYYVTTTAGTYTNFGGLVVNNGELALLTYNGVWQKVAVTLPAGGGGAAVEVVDNLDSESTTSALSANQGRVLKEMINTNSGKKVYQFPAGLVTSTISNHYHFTEEEVAEFIAAVSDLANTDFVLNFNDDVGNNTLRFIQNVYDDYDGQQLYSFDTAYGKAVLVTNDFDKIVTYTILLQQSDAQVSGFIYTSTLEVDTEMSDTSMNPVQNKAIKEYVDNAVAGSGGGGVAKLMTATTWADLVALRDAGNLVAGMKYRITDYETKTSKAGSQSAGHPFDIIVTALDGSTLDEKASAIQSARDTDGYFANSNLEAWDVRYCLDNNKSRFDWAVVKGKSIEVDLTELDAGNVTATLNGTFVYNDTTYTRWDTSVQGMKVYILTPSEDVTIGSTPIAYIVAQGQGVEGGTITSVTINENEGKGVIYRLIDDKENDVPYDFKNIQFVRKITNGALDLEDGADTYCYTFSDFSTGISLDASENSSTIICNKFGAFCWNNVFIGNCYSNTFGNSCYSNTLGDGCYYITLGDSCSSNTLGNSCISNTLGNSCISNTLGNSCIFNTLGNICDSNTLGNSCISNTLGNSCNSNTLGDSCSSNTLGDSCSSNTLGDNCDYNTLGDVCYSNTFGYDCSSNTFGNDCSSNTLGNNCDSNAFGDDSNGNTFGDSCHYNIFGNSCSSNTFGYGCYYNTFGNNCDSNTFGNGCSSNTFGNYCDSNAFGTADAPLSSIKYYKVDCVSNAEIAATASRNFVTYVTKKSNGDVVQYTIDDILNA